MLVTHGLTMMAAHEKNRSDNWWFWTAKRVGRLHKSCDWANHFQRHSKRSEIFTTLMALRWIIFCTMKKIGSYIILVGIFYQLLIQSFSFYSNIYLIINNMIITTQLTMMFLPSIFHILKCYFGFINLSWILNIKRQPRQNCVEEI